MSRSLIVLPDDSAAPILAAIESARRTLRIKMFVFSDARLASGLIAAARRKVKVRVMLNRARRRGEQDNERIRRVLEHGGVAVRDANPAFAVTHEKSMVVDDSIAVVQSLNWATRNLTQTRDYAVVTHRRSEVAEIADAFDADWRRRPFQPRDGSDLIWCPGPGRAHLCRFIDEARHRLFVQNERYQDIQVIERLVRAARRGVKVSIMARPPHTLKSDQIVDGVAGLRLLDDVGIEIRRLGHLKLHGKMMVADGAAAIVGSINFAPGSLDGRRELAIEVRAPAVVARLDQVARHDWADGHRLDLSDEGVRADLDGRVEGAEARLGLENRDWR
jgi:Phosphatidylserine/phosphatidylglycerophosphate/cardiolipin synthases and related enzymes